MKAFAAVMRGLIWQFAARDHTKMLSGLGRIHYVVVTGDKFKAAGRHPAWYVSQSSGEADLFVWGREDDGKVYFGGYCRGQEKMWHRKRCRVDQGGEAGGRYRRKPWGISKKGFKWRHRPATEMWFEWSDSQSGEKLERAASGSCCVTVLKADLKVLKGPGGKRLSQCGGPHRQHAMPSEDRPPPSLWSATNSVRD